MAKKFKKVLISLIVFAITFVNYGLPLQAIASESKSIFKFRFFHKDEISLNAYFDDGEEEKVLDVNDTTTLTIDVTPQVAGYLESGSLKLNLENGNENNFKIQSVTIEESKDEETEKTVEEKNEEVEDTKGFNVIKETNLLESTTKNFGKSLIDTSKNTILDPSLINKEDTSKSEENVIEETEGTATTDDVSGSENTSKPEDSEESIEIDNKENDIEEISEELENYEVKLVSENEIQLTNIIADTKIFVELAYKQNETIRPEDLYSDITILLEGNYINGDLENVDIYKEKYITLGWEYSKVIEITSNYTKVSPFTVGDNIGTIIENVVTVKRNIEEENFLPIKETNIKIEIPRINDKLPTAINVAANKLMATTGNEVVGVEVIKNNCSFDEETGLLEIKITNTRFTHGKGEDTFNIICRYEDYIEEETIKLNRNVLVTVEEFNSNSNKIQEKSITKEQEIEVKAGELISYFMTSTDEKINKGRINANYYTENKYETQFSNIVNLNVLTSDILQEIILEPSKDSYIDKDGNTLDATSDVKFKGVKFKSAEIKEMLEKGSTIDLLDENNNVFHTISKENSISSIVFSEKINIVKVRINHVQINGNIRIEFVKAIETSVYAPAEFNAISKVTSSVKASVKYAGFEEMFALPEIETEKEFSETNTNANLTMDREYLSTIAENENVELKIELNNNLETSDFYKNPHFEIEFPSFIKEVKLNTVYTLYQNGLSIRDYQVINENGVNKIKIDFEGTQTEFNTSSITNGTNIIVNANLVVDEITPRKLDEIKLFYCNEAVTNYQTQTNWNISKEIPEGILKDTNGYDSAVFEYQAPTGLITINSITNYDGTGTTVKSIREGEKTSKIPIQSGSQISTMELVVLNNTGNECVETVLLGRIPFKGNKDVETGKDLGTNIDTLMKSTLIADSQNSNMSTIYYSVKEDADQDLNKQENGWSVDGSNIEEIKSFMIVIDGAIQPGGILKYKYDFEIPENLGFDVKLLGSFGAFYNNKSENLVVYETSVADKVGLVTDVGPKLEASLSVDIGDGAEIAESKRLKYTVKVTNVGSIVANDLMVKVQRPNNTNIVKKDEAFLGDYGYILDNRNNEPEFFIEIGTLNPGESNSVSYFAKAGYIQGLEEYADGKDENGYFIYKEGTEKLEKTPKIETEIVGEVEENIETEDSDTTENEKTENSETTEKEDKEEMIITAEKEYITEVPDTYITSKATVTSSLLTEPIETNEVRNKLVHSNFESDIRVDFDRDIKAGMETNFTFIFRNISGQNLENVVAELNVGKIYHYQLGKIDGQDGNILFDEQTGKLSYYIGAMEDNQEIILTAQMFANQIETGKEIVDCYFDVFADDLDEYRSTIIPQMIVKSILEAKDISVLLPETIKENETIVVSTQIDNIGSLECTEGVFEATVSETMDVVDVATSSGMNLTTGNGTGVISTRLPLIGEGESLTIDILLKAKNTSGQNAKIADITRTIKNLDQEDIILDNVQVTILNTEKTEEEIEQERIEQVQKEHEEQKRQEEEALRQEEEENAKKNEESNKDSVETDENGNFVNSSNNNSNNGNNNNGNSGNSSGNNASNQNNNLNNTTNLDSNDNNNQTNQTNQSQTTSKEKYAISGSAWIDTNKNGTRDNEDKALSGVKVYLLTLDNKMLKSTITNSSGKYQFNQVEIGKYVVAAEFDEDKYAVTTYKKSGIPEDQNSDVIKSEYEKLSALTNEINVTNANIGNVDIGLQNKDTFDLTVKKYISKVVVTTNKRNETYEFDNLETAKVEIKAKEIEGAKVDLEYTIVLENIGNVDGYVEQLVDYLDKDMQFNESKNSEWAKGNDGYVYAKNINKVVLKQGEKKEFKLYVTKNMTEDNVGTVANKVSILKAYNKNNEKENTENNTAVQNTVILVSTGYTAQIVSTIVFIVLLTMVVYITNNKKRIRNSDFSAKINTKKVYK